MFKKAKYIILALVVIAIAGLSFSTYYFRSQYLKVQGMVSNPQEASKNEIADIVAKISLSMVLPEEEPTLATVLEADKLKEQPFFSKSENGDKVLIYTQAKKAILYRPSQNRIIEVSPFSPSNENNIVSEEVTPTPTPSVTKAITPIQEGSDTPDPSTATEE